MTTISLLRDIKELETFKIKHLPIPHIQEFCKDYEWIKNEYNKWSKQFLYHNPRVDAIAVDYCCVSYINYKSKERQLIITKIFGYIMYVSEYLYPARMEKSAPKMVELCNALLTTMKTGQCDPGSAIGERLVNCLALFKDCLNDQQFYILQKYLEEGLKAQMDIHCNFFVNDKVIPLKDYVYLRERENCWILFTTILSEYSVGFEMSSDIRSNQLVKEYTEKCTELALAVDDYYITRMKIMTNDMTSRIISLLSERKCTLQEAFENQFEYTMDLYKQCTDLRDKINGNSEIASELLSHWMDQCLEYFLRFFQFAVIIHDIQVNEDQTLRSAKWDEAYNQLQTKAEKTGNRFFL